MKRKTTRHSRSAEVTKASMQKWFEKRARRGTLSPAHNLAHVESVGIHAGVLAEEMARKSGASKDSAKRTRRIAEATGTVHDIVRRATERTPHGVRGATTIKRMATLYPRVFGEFTPREIDILADATKAHELSFRELTKAIRGFSPRKKIVARSVHMADKLFEASGYRVLERRAFFVGKERLKGDLKYLKRLYGANAPLYAVAMESCMRLRARNVLGDYPKAIQPIARSLHVVQEKFYFGLLKQLGLTETRLIQEMERIKFPKFDRYNARIKSEVAKAASDRKVASTSKAVARDAAELVLQFNKAGSADTVLSKWKPKGKQAREWLQGMKSARVGGTEYLARLQRQIRRALTR